MTNPSDNNLPEMKEKVGIGAYISLFFAICFFSGVFYKMPAAYE